MFNLFKKKGDDDFSDLGADLNEGLPDTSGGPTDHLGLPPDGDITRTSLNSDQGQDPFQSSSSNSSFNAPPQQNSSPDTFAFKQAQEQMQQSQQSQSPFQQASPHLAPQSQGTSHDVDKDLQLINAKLDSIKSFMEAINQRLVSIERAAHDSRPPQKNEQVRW